MPVLSSCSHANASDRLSESEMPTTPYMEYEKAKKKTPETLYIHPTIFLSLCQSCMSLCMHATEIVITMYHIIRYIIQYVSIALR